MAKLKHKKGVQRRWKLGKMTGEEYRGNVWEYVDTLRKSKAQLELIERDIKENNVIFMSVA